MIDDKISPYDYAIFFRLVTELPEDILIRKIRSVKDVDTPAGQRDFYIEFYEPGICPEGYTQGASRYRMTLHRVTDQSQLDSRVRIHNPTYCLAIEQLKLDANQRRVTDFAINLHDYLGPQGQCLLDNLVMHFKRGEDRVLSI